MSVGFGRHLKSYLEFYNISQSEFASRLNITQKHMNEIINGKADMSLDLIVSICNITGVSIDFIIKSEYSKKVAEKLYSKYSKEELEYMLKNKLYIDRLNTLKWIDFKNSTNIIQNYIDIIEYLKIRDLESLDRINEKVLFKKKETDAVKINLWIARCEDLVKNQKVNEYQKENFNFLIGDLKEIMYKDKEINTVKIQKLLNNYGIYFMVEETLSGTDIKGCFKVKLKNPAIYINKNYKDKYDFYFELFHEMGHCKSDYNVGKSKIIIDGDDMREQRADNFAKNTIFGKDVFEKLKNDLTEKELKKISREYKIPIEFLNRIK